MAFEVTENIAVEKVLLERVDFMLSGVVGRKPIYLQDARVRLHEIAHVADELVMTLRGWMVGNKFPDRSEFAEFSYPAGWWQMLKSQHAPKWFLARWPVKKVEHRFECAHYRYHICPHWAEDFSREKMPHIAYLEGRPELYRGENHD